jgi:hypothetical protein
LGIIKGLGIAMRYRNKKIAFYKYIVKGRKMYYTFYKKPDGRVRYYTSPDFNRVKGFWLTAIKNKYPYTPTTMPKNVLQSHQRNRYTIYVTDDKGRAIQKISPLQIRKTSPVTKKKAPSKKPAPKLLPEFDLMKLLKLPKFKFPGIMNDDYDDDFLGDELV